VGFKEPIFSFFAVSVRDFGQIMRIPAILSHFLSRGAHSAALCALAFSSPL